MVERTSRNSVPWLRLAIIVVIAALFDQVTKAIVVREIQRGAIIHVIPGLFDLTLNYNTGAAFGVFSGLSDGIRSWVLLATTAIAFGVVIYYMRTPHGQSRLAQFAFALIIGGAFGNLIDRLRLGMVVDFLDFYLRGYHWPAFNAADSFICVGVVLLLLSPAPQEVAQTSDAKAPQ